MSTTPAAHPAFGAAAAEIVAAGRRLGARGLIAGTDGNLSVRLGPFAVAVTPAGRRKDELVAADIVAVPLGPIGAPDAPATPAHAPAHLRPSSDLLVHRAVYAARPEAGAIAHAHPPAVLGCLLAGLVPDAAVLPEARLVLGRVAYVPALPLGSPEVAAAAAAALADPGVGAVLLDRHGALAVGRTLAEAVDRLEVLELLCRAWHGAWVAGRDPRRRAAPRRPRGRAAGRTAHP